MILSKTKEVYNKLLDSYKKSDSGQPITDSDFRAVKEEIANIVDGSSEFEWIEAKLVSEW